VLARVSRENGCYRLCTKNDGRGFRCSGCSWSTEPEASSHDPVVPKEYVRAISSNLMTGLVPGSDARLVILVLSAAHGRVYSHN
jgi:hypothetical protein